MNSRRFDRTFVASRAVLLAACLLAVPLVGCGDDGTADTVCFVGQAEGGQRVITCDDGVQVEVPDGAGGADGTVCEAEENADGSVTITCEDGTTATVDDGADGTACTVVNETDGSVSITCDDGTEATADGADNCVVSENEAAGTVTITCDDGEATINDGAPGGACTITDTVDGITISCDDGTEVDVADGGDCAIAENDDGDIVVACEGGTEITVIPAEDRISTLTGRALYFDQDDHSDITVTLTAPDGSQLIVTTGSNGEYTFADVAVGSYTLTFQADGYNTETLTSVPAVPGTFHVRDVILRYDVQVEPAGDVYIVDVCSEGDDGSPGAVVYLEEPYSFVQEEKAAALVAGDCGPAPGEPITNTSNVFGRLVYFDPSTGDTHTLGDDVWGGSVLCSPDGTGVAFMTDADPEYMWGDLHVWWRGMAEPVQLAPDPERLFAPGDGTGSGSGSGSGTVPASLCGLSFSPTSDSLAYLAGYVYVMGDFPGVGDLALYQRDDGENRWMAPDVRCGFEYQFPDLSVQVDSGRGRDPVADFHSEYEFAPNGGSIHVLGGNAGGYGTYGVFQLNLAGDDAELPLLLSTYPTLWRPGAFRPDGSLLAYLGEIIVPPSEPAGVVAIDYGLHIVDLADSTPSTSEAALDQFLDLVNVTATPVPLSFHDDIVPTQFFEWSPDGTRLLFADGYPETPVLQVVDVPAEIDESVPIPEANYHLIAESLVNEFGFPAAFDPNSALVAYTVPDLDGPLCTGQPAAPSGVTLEGIADLCLFDLAGGGYTRVTGLARPGAPEVSFPEDGSVFAYADYPDVTAPNAWDSALTLYDLGAGGEPRTLLDEGPFSPDEAAFNVLWAPDAQSLLFDNEYNSAGVLHNLGAYEVGGDNTDVMVELGTGNCGNLPFQYRNDGATVLGLFTSGAPYDARIYDAADVQQAPLEISESARFASYAEDGTSVAIVETPEQRLGYTLVRWDGPGEDDRVVIESDVDIESHGFAYRENTLAYALFELFFPGSLRNGAHYSVIP